MKDFLETLIHLYAFCLFVRALFPGPSRDMFSISILPFVCAITDPVLLFLKKNRLSVSPKDVLFPLMLLFFLKAVLIRSLVQSGLPWNTAFLISVSGFIYFLFKMYLLVFWLVFSANRFHYFDLFFSLLSALLERTLTLIPGIEKKSPLLRNAPKAFCVVLCVFYVCFLILIALEGFMTSLFSTQSMLEGGLRYLLHGLLEVLEFLPFLIIVRMIISFFMPPPSLALEILLALTEPILEPFRRMRLIIGVFDFSPVAAFIVLSLALQFFRQIIN